MAIGFITRRGAPPTEPFAYTYTGESILTVESEGIWNIKFLTSGTFILIKDVVIDAFLCGGGSSGGSWSAAAGGPGGGGGYTYVRKNFTLFAGAYPIVIGQGGVQQAFTYSIVAGGNTTAFGNTANGATTQAANGGGGHGGSGGCGGGSGTTSSRAGGVNGGNGAAGAERAGGTGQGTTTRAFGEAEYPLFANGGSFVYPVQQGAAGAANTGDGGNAGMGEFGGNGGSGIVWIRSART